MTKGPPKNLPSAADFNLPLVEHCPPHGFPPYLGLGLLDTTTLRLDPGESIAEFRAGDDLVYRVRGTFDPDENPSVSTACGATNSSWDIEEFFGGKSWRRTAGYSTLSQVFFHHLAEQLPTENPRIAALLRRLTEEHLVAVLKADRSFRTEFERGIVCDVTVALFRLEQTLDRLQAAKAVAAPVHRRPEVIYAHEHHRKFSQVHPGRLQDGVVTYQVIPIDEDTPSAEALEATFVVDSVETFFLVQEAYKLEPPEDVAPRSPNTA